MCLPLLSTLPSNPTFSHFFLSNLSEFLHLFFFYPFSFLFSFYLVLHPQAFGIPPSSIHTCSTSPHPSVTQLLVLSLQGAFTCFSKVIFSEFERFHFTKLSIRSSNVGEKESHLEALMTALCFKCYICTKNAVQITTQCSGILIRNIHL